MGYSTVLGEGPVSSVDVVTAAAAALHCLMTFPQCFNWKQAWSEDHNISLFVMFIWPWQHREHGCRWVG